MTVEYRVIQGDTWSSIAYKAYGDASQYETILKTNPSQPITGPTPGTLILIPVPDVQTQQAQVQTQNLPPWKVR